jgi:hypothetical protein
LELINEIVQWALLVILGLLLLGVLRQVGLMLPPPESRELASGPSLGGKVPNALLVRVRAIRNGSSSEPTILAFVAESCPACQHLLAELPSGEDRMPQLVLVAKQPTASFRVAVETTGYPVIVDESGDLWRSAKVTATPLVMRISGDGTVEAKEVTHRVDSVAIRVQRLP